MSGGIVIATVPRSGSWLLADALERTGLCGSPREYLREDYRPRYAAAWGLPSSATPLEYVQQGILGTATPNGAYGVKVHWGQLEEFAGRVAGGDPGDALERCFPGARYVFLTRADKLRQAVSLRRAVRSDVWWKVEGEAADRQDAAVAQPTAADLDEVARLQRILAEHEERWAALFATGRFGDPIRVSYDDLASDYSATIARTLDRLGVACSGPIPPARLERQADDLTDEWIRAFRHRQANRAAPSEVAT